MRRLMLLLGLACGSMFLHACGVTTTPPPPPVATHFSVSSTSISAVAGVAFNVTVTALDASGAIVTGYQGVAGLISSDPQAQLPGPAPMPGGTASFSVILKTAGNQTLTAAGGGLMGTSNPIAVSPAAAAALSISGPSAQPTAGSPFTITVNAFDSFGNVATSYSGTAQLSSSDPQATLPGPSQLTNGTALPSVTLRTAGTPTLTASDSANQLTASSPTAVSVKPAAATRFVVTGAAAATVGFNFAATVSAQDPYNNLATSYSGAPHLTSSDTQATIPATATVTSGTGNFTVTFKSLGNQTVTATDASAMPGLAGTSGPIKVVTNAATHFSVTGPSSGVLARQTFSLAVGALDAANNPSAGYGGTVHFTSSDASAKLPADSVLAAGAGSFSATLETLAANNQPINQTISVTDTVAPAITGSATINISAAAQFAIPAVNPPNGTVGTVYGRVVPTTEYLDCSGTYPLRVTCMWELRADRVSCNLLRSNLPCFTGQTRVVPIFHGFALAADGGVPGRTWSATGLPPGLTVDPPTGQVLGTPTSPGTFTVGVTVLDGGNPSAQTTGSFPLTIAKPAVPVVKTSPAPPPGVVGFAYGFTFTATGYPPLTWIESGPLPGGVLFDGNSGALAGSPSATGSFPITVTATDQFGQSSVPQAFTIAINAHGFVLTGSMTSPRQSHTATLLSGGLVLLAGGQGSTTAILNTAETYDPNAQTFTALSVSMTSPRAQHTATLLPSGSVLLVGGSTGTAPTATAEIYDPVAKTFTATTGALATARAGHTATLLTMGPDAGKVLIVGGGGAGGSSLASAELFDPSTGNFTAAKGNLQTPREGHTATLLPDGRVLIAGGVDYPSAAILNTAELYDPVAGTFSLAKGMMQSPRFGHTATLLGTTPARVLIAGGADTNTSQVINTAELFDPVSQSFTSTSGNLVSAKTGHSATVLGDGTVLLAGGIDVAGTALSDVEVYTPAAQTFAPTGGLVIGRSLHTATLLGDGTVLATGGRNAGKALASAEVYH